MHCHQWTLHMPSCGNISQSFCNVPNSRNCDNGSERCLPQEKCIHCVQLDSGKYIFIASKVKLKRYHYLFSLSFHNSVDLPNSKEICCFGLCWVQLLSLSPMPPVDMFESRLTTIFFCLACHLFSIIFQ